MIRIGPAGWHYQDWRGVVYPDPSPSGFNPIGWLADYFDTIEINSSFYGPPTPATARKWVAQAGDHEQFRFSAKLWRRFTHERKEAFTRDEVKLVRQGFDPLYRAGRLGAVLLQFPWSFKRDEIALQWLDDVIAAFRRYPLVLEVRHASWNTPEFYRELSEQGIGFVNIDQPLFSRSIRPSAVVTSPIGYIRVHGRNYQDWFRKGAGVYARYDYLYSAEELKPWAQRARQVDKATAETFVVTNNHARGKSVVNGLMLEAMLKKRKVPAPPEVVAEYGEELKGLVRACPPGEFAII
ncbi:MAG TPA: DUF72 domain-containing protein [Gemmatimonadales bacterium]|nr:DUF72 domain-containing protein [Gemmatimonadales bacterium]